MRLHRLTLRGIGPFVDEYSVDFDDFKDAGLFLLEGPTGSGKSTIIDAIVFALFGDPAGKETSKDRLRSDYLSGSDDSFVELDFSTPSGLYRVRRTPQFTRATRSGSETTVNSTASFAKFNSPDAAHPEVLVTKIGEVHDEVERVTGLTRKQFTQTVVLPQGEFDSFLRAKPDDRQVLLQQLFGTQVFERVENLLVAQRKVAQRARGDAEDIIMSAVGAFTGAAALADDVAAEVVSLQGDTAALDARMDFIVAGLAEHVRVAKQAVDSAADELASARQVFETATAARALRDELIALRAHAAALSEQQPTIDDLVARLAAAERAVPVVAALRELDAAADRLNTSEERLARATDFLATADREVAVDQWRDHMTALRELAVSLAPAVTRESEVAGLRAQVSNVTDSRDEVAKSLEHEQAIVDAAPAQLASLDKELRELRDAVARIELLKSQHAALKVRADAATALTELLPKQAAAHDVTATAVRAADAAEAAAREAHVRWRAGIAAELATTLEPGVPCQVCGSTQHPTPAQPSDDHVSAETVDQLAAAASEARGHVDQLVREQGELDAEVARQETLRGADEPGLSGSLQTIADELDAANRAALKVPTREADKAKLEAAVATATDKVSKLTADLARLDEQLERAKAAVADAEAEIRDSRADFESVAARVSDLNARVAAITDCLSIASERDTAATLVSSRRDTLTTAVTAAKFGSVDEARDSAADEADRKKWAATIETHKNDVLVTERDAASVRFATVDVTAPIEVDAPKARFESATAAHNDAVAAHGTAVRTHDLAVAARSRVRDTVADSEEVIAQTAPVIRMADLVASSDKKVNPLNMPLVAYVLREEFEHVVDAANARLQLLSEGRFLLRRTESTGGRLHTGLGLEVADLDTGRTREPASLSGGETFYTSLALALGLSDVVVARSGGIQLETLFVDEGFGSLDPERLDEVLNILNKLKASGRTIGVISHVTEMKEAIPARIEVRRADRGSTISVRA